MPLGEVLSRLEQADLVVATLLLGSTANDELTATSNFDLMVVVDRADVTFDVEVSYIDERFTDVLLAGSATVSELTTVPYAEWSQEARRVAHYSPGARVMFDRSGEIGRA